MLTDTEAIVLRQVKTSYGRKMILLFSKRYGKISAGTGIGEKGRSKSSLALRPFTYGRYELFKNKDSYNINAAEVIKSYYKIGEDVDKYMNGAYVLEFTEKALAEEVPAPAVFRLMTEFFDMLETRDKAIGTLVLAYQVKLFRYLGIMPELERCTVCGEEKDAAVFSIKDGGIVCDDCLRNLENSDNDTLIYDAGFGIVNILRYFTVNPLKSIEKLALKEDAGRLLQRLVREYAAHYLDISELKSEELV
ncbi:MAG: DNA repair protein RecO [Firmicutes bacterium]|nr:DNA repair protein RecO [Bacillota bacterium]